MSAAPMAMGAQRQVRQPSQWLQCPQRGFRQVKNLHEIVYTAQTELHQRTSKYLERTDKVYKPS